MFRTYIQVALRNFGRHKAFTIINLSGLAVGIASCIVLFMVVNYELSYDKFLPEHDRINHVILKQVYPDRTTIQSGVPTPALDALRTDFPDIITGTLVGHAGGQVTVLGKDPNTSSDRKYIEETGLMFADPEFFDVFRYPWLNGSPETLREPNTIAVTKAMAAKYFGGWQDAVGQYLRLDNAITFKVTGVLEDVPANTDFPLGIVASLVTNKNNPEIWGYSDDWGDVSSDFQVFMKLPPGRDPAIVNQQLESFSRKHYAKTNRAVKSNMLQPLAEIHFAQDIESFGSHRISRSTLWALSLVGVFIILMACINFINMSTAQAVNRSKEIGIRKVLGGRRSSLFRQMMGETATMVFVATVIGVILAMLCLPFIRHVASIQEPLSVFNMTVLGFVVLLALLVTLLAGSYPALVVSGFNPLLALKNKFSSASIAGVSLRRALVVLQFTISQALIIGTIVAVWQMSAIKNADLGFNKDAVMIINSSSDSVIQSRQEAFKSELLGNPDVKSVSFSSDVPSSENFWSNNFAFDHKEDESFPVNVKYADQDYFNTYGIKFLAGHGYEKSDTARDIVVNQTLITKLGVTDPASILGKDIRIGGGRWRKIIGVVKDFQTNSLRDDTKPLYIAPRREYYSTTGIQISSSNLATATARIQETWNKFYPEYANTSSFMDERISEFYEQEDQLALLYKIFAGIAIFISCLGLYGLVSFMAVQRTREVGIRKTLGATAAQIVYLFSREFTILVLVAFAVAAPLAWYVMNKWLQNFAFKINIGAGVFVLAIVSSMLIAWITVGYKSVRAALANPVKSLRSE